MIDYSITELDISKQDLTQLPGDIHKYTNLKKLYCWKNKLTSLDNLPPTLKELWCFNNPLKYNFKPTIENIRNYNSSKKSN